MKRGFSDLIAFSFIHKYKNKYVELLPTEFFDEKCLNDVLPLVRLYYRDKMDFPSYPQLELMMVNENGKNNYSFSDEDFDVLRNIYESEVIEKYDIHYVESLVRDRIAEKSIYELSGKVIDIVREADYSDGNGVNVLNNIKTVFNDSVGFGFDDDLGIDLYDPEQLKPEKEDTIPTGIPFIDNKLNGGYSRGALTVYMGESGIGKSWFLSNDAVNFVKGGYNVVFITLEMSEHEICNRIAPNLYSENSDTWKKNVEKDNPAEVKKIIKNFINNHETITGKPPGALYVKDFPMGSANAYDIHDYIRRLQQFTKRNVDVIIVDYLNVMSPNIRSRGIVDNTYQLLRYVSMELKKLAKQSNTVVVTACQANRAQYGQTEIELRNIADSTAIVQNSDNILGIFQDANMSLSDQWGIKILKFRNGIGKDESTLIRCDPETMTFHYE